MSFRLEIKTGNFSRDENGYIVGTNTSLNAVSVVGTSRDIYSGIRSIAYVQSGALGLILRFSEKPNGSQQYYQFRLNTSNFVAIEEVNNSKSYISPTILQSKPVIIGGNTSHYLSFTVSPLNESVDVLKGYFDDMVVCQYAGALNLSGGQQGIFVQSGVSRFDSNVVAGREIDYYCTPTDVKKLLQGIGVSAVTDEGEISSLIVKASEDINKRTGSVFGRLAKVTDERHEGHGEVSIIVEHTPLKSVSRIDIYNYANSLVSSLVPGDGSYDNLIIEEDTGEITLSAKSTELTPIYGVGLYPVQGRGSYTYRDFDYSQFFGSGRRNIIVSYMYGHDDIPQHIVEATRKLAGIEVLIKIGNYNTKGTTSLKLGDAVEDYRSSDNLPFSGTIAKWQQDINNALKDYDVMFMEAV